MNGGTYNRGSTVFTGHLLTNWTFCPAAVLQRLSQHETWSKNAINKGQLQPVILCWGYFGSESIVAVKHSTKKKKEIPTCIVCRFILFKNLPFCMCKAVRYPTPFSQDKTMFWQCGTIITAINTHDLRPDISWRHCCKSSWASHNHCQSTTMLTNKSDATTYTVYY